MATVEETTTRVVGTPVKRVEDPRLPAVNLEVQPIRPGSDCRAAQRRCVLRDDGGVHQEIHALQRPPHRRRIGGIEPYPPHPLVA